MRAFCEYNPIVVTAYYLAATGILMFSADPVLLIIGLAGALSYFLLKKGAKGVRLHLFCLFLFIVLTIINPLFSHNGKTVLFVINDSPVTLEATVYGAVSAGTMVTVLYLFRSFTDIMTRDKLLYVFGKLSPKAALVLSMGLRYVPLFSERAKRISESQRALGFYKEDNIIDKIKCDLRVFSILVTWALENGIMTADSMAARGYGIRKRTYYSVFKLERTDVFILILIVLCSVTTVIGIGFGAIGATFYPGIELSALTPLGIASYISYGILSFLPLFTETEESLRWRYLLSKI